MTRMSSSEIDLQHPHLPLGKEVGYPDRYDPALLHPISRSQARVRLGVQAVDEQCAPVVNLPFCGWDLWHGYELSWLDLKGLPQVAILRAWVGCDSPNIIESKSFKLYLNSLNGARYPDVTSLSRQIETDLTARCGAPVKIEIITPDRFHSERIEEPVSGCLDELDISIDRYQPDASLLGCNPGQIVTESVFSRLLKSNCPVTGQPDWASVHIEYTGPAIDHPGLLRYIVSYREHQGFHEQCVEQIFCDLMAQCKPQSLSVYARYTRRGGMDINPWRATHGHLAPRFARSAQQ